MAAAVANLTLYAASSIDNSLFTLPLLLLSLFIVYSLPRLTYRRLVFN
jgi:hypothetical protein